MSYSFKRSIALAGVAAMLSISVPAHAGPLSVTDAKMLLEAKRQVDQLRDQLSEVKRAYASVTGTRGLGDILNDRTLRNTLPADWRQVYDGVNRGGYSGISGSIDSILENEAYDGSIDDGMTNMRDRQRRLAATSKATGMEAFSGAERRLAQIDGLRAEINRTNDSKGIAELQARLSAEQAAIQNEQTKLQLMAMLQASEEKLALQQRREMSSRITNPANTGMPTIN